jgi:spore germination protein YaaH
MRLSKSTLKSIVLYSKLLVVIVFFITVVFLESSNVNASNDVNNNNNETKFNMSYLYFGNTASYIEQVAKTSGALDTVAPSYFDLNTDGSLKIKVDPVFVDEMHKQNIRVVPFLSNHWDRNLGRKALANRKQLAKQVADAISKYQLDGVNVDIENVSELDRDNYTDFVRLLREYIPKSKEVSVAVAANPNGWVKGWHGSYDYEKLAEYSDYLMLMAYDESYQGSKPGPVASISFVEKSIQYALKQNVPREKIVLGVPFFARYWNNGAGGYGIGSNTIDALVENYNGKIHYDTDSESPYAKFTINKNDPVTRINSKNLTQGNYVVWFEDINSIEKKIGLVHKYNLKGTGSWSLNQAPTNIWGQFTAMLNSTGFYDIDTHWAKANILEMVEKEWMLGVSKTQFLPDRSLTRAEVTTVLVRALDLRDKVSSSFVIDVIPFKDIDNHWAKHEISIAYRFGLIEGLTETIFAPNEYLTREQMATLLTRIVSIVEDSTVSKDDTVTLSEAQVSIFRDIEFSRWSYPSISVMASRNILRGFDDGNFYPSNFVTRAELATVMNRLTHDEIATNILKF